MCIELPSATRAATRAASPVGQERAAEQYTASALPLPWRELRRSCGGPHSLQAARGGDLSINRKEARRADDSALAFQMYVTDGEHICHKGTWGGNRQKPDGCRLVKSSKPRGTKTRCSASVIAETPGARLPMWPLCDLVMASAAGSPREIHNGSNRVACHASQHVYPRLHACSDRLVAHWLGRRCQGAAARKGPAPWKQP